MPFATLLFFSSHQALDVSQALALTDMPFLLFLLGVGLLHKQDTDEHILVLRSLLHCCVGNGRRTPATVV